MVSALITVTILLLGPGLAYFQSPVSLTGAGFTSSRAGVRAGMQRRGRFSVPKSMARNGCRYMPATGDDPFAPLATMEKSDDSGASPGSPEVKSSAPKADPKARDAMRAVHCEFVSDRLIGVRGGAGLHRHVLRAVRPWLRGGYLDGSGSGDPADNKHGTSLRPARRLLFSHIPSPLQSHLEARHDDLATWPSQEHLRSLVPPCSFAGWETFPGASHA